MESNQGKNRSVQTGRDISIEINGRRAAVVESYRVKAVRSVYEVEELGSDVPAAAIGGRQSYELTLKRVRLTNSGEVDFYSLENFDVVIVRPDGRVVYSGCEWAQIEEGASVGSPCAETMILTAARRVCP